MCVLACTCVWCVIHDSQLPGKEALHRVLIIAVCRETNMFSNNLWKDSDRNSWTHTHSQNSLSLSLSNIFARRTGFCRFLYSQCNTTARPIFLWSNPPASLLIVSCFPLILLMMIAFITIKSSLVPLIEGLCAQIYFRFEISVVCSHLLLFFFVKEKTC